MTAVILTIHTILVMALVAVVLLQRSEGGALGMGGGGGGMMSGRGAANMLTRSTTILGALFFTTSMVLALMTDRGTTQEDMIRSVTGETELSVPDQSEAGNLGADEILDILGNDAASPEVLLPEAPVVDEEVLVDEPSPEL